MSTPFIIIFVYAEIRKKHVKAKVSIGLHFIHMLMMCFAFIHS